jgi:hypothetical protein
VINGSMIVRRPMSAALRRWIADQIGVKIIK